MEIFGFSNNFLNKHIFFHFITFFVELFGFSDIFHNQHDLFRTRDDDLSGGLKAFTRKAMHMLNGQRQVPMQEAVHMLVKKSSIDGN